MKLMFVFLVLFATQIIHLKAQLHRNNNAFGVTGFEKPEINFWKNPFSHEEGMTA